MDQTIATADSKIPRSPDSNTCIKLNNHYSHAYMDVLTRCREALIEMQVTFEVDENGKGCEHYNR